ncbi:F-box/LRR-repeat protein At5g02910-like [Panicum virgatum]|uniref:F-box/LRR-repeat protein At5g02910-like n=1 Tax=Panicum virgatum TaxID=38727 RepID=UPI0019D59A4E|nr:F-box/LRR-repeat protein At5g02910-like [Panicum virgatum]
MHSRGGSKRRRTDEGAEQPDAGSLKPEAETGKDSTTALLLGASCSKKRRAGGVAEGGQTEAAPEVEDRISALPEDLRLRILALLPLKSAIRTGALSSPWRALWARRWPAPPSLDLLLLLPLDDPDQLLESLERRGRRRLDRFALTVHWFPYPHRFLGDKDVHRCLDYAPACGVEDLHIDMADHMWRTCPSSLRFPSGFSRLVRLSLLRVGSVSFGYPLSSDAFPALEVIHLRSARSVDLNRLLSVSPRLRTLDVRYCQSVDTDGDAIDIGAAQGHLRSLTVAECSSVSHIYAGTASGLRPPLPPPQQCLTPHLRHPVHCAA